MKTRERKKEGKEISLKAIVSKYQISVYGIAAKFITIK